MQNKEKSEKRSPLGDGKEDMVIKCNLMTELGFWKRKSTLCKKERNLNKVWTSVNKNFFKLVY